MSPERAIAEIDDLLRTMPTLDQFESGGADVPAWRGRFMAVVRHVHPSASVEAAAAMSQLGTIYGRVDAPAKIASLLHELRYAQVLTMPAPTSTLVAAHSPFDYFDTIRQLLDTATKDAFFVDPYLDASFVARYLPHVRPGVTVRLLGSNNVAALASSAAAFAGQSGLSVQVRKGSQLHDRFLFIDRLHCHQSGASFKDGGGKSAATITQIVDAFNGVLTTYESIWQQSPVS